MNIAGIFALAHNKQLLARGIDLPIAESQRIMEAILLEVHEIAAGMMMPAAKAPARSRPRLVRVDGKSAVGSYLAE